MSVCDLETSKQGGLSPIWAVAPKKTNHYNKDTRITSDKHIIFILAVEFTWAIYSRFVHCFCRPEN